MDTNPTHRPRDMAGIHITDIEAAINWWRERKPSPDGITACAEVRALAVVYALMVYYREPECDEATMPAAAREAWLAWYDTTPDTPCIAICSTSQGDATCKGCGRSFAEVQRWPEMSPGEKRATWRRITLEGSAWRFNRYAERAGEQATSPAMQQRPPEPPEPPATAPAAPILLAEPLVQAAEARPAMAAVAAVTAASAAGVALPSPAARAATAFRAPPPPHARRPPRPKRRRS